jgi:hypothetical protein
LSALEFIFLAERQRSRGRGGYFALSARWIFDHTENTEVTENTQHAAHAVFVYTEADGAVLKGRKIDRNNRNNRFYLEHIG